MILIEGEKMEDVLNKLDVSDKNKEIVRKFMNGDTMAALGLEYGVSAPRIREVILYCKRRAVWKRYKNFDM